MEVKTASPPTGYSYHQNLFADLDSFAQKPPWLIFLRANFWALLPLAAAVLLLWLPYQIYLHLGTPLAYLPAWQPALGWRVTLGLIIIIGSMLLHEWLHGLALRLCGHQPHYGFNKLFLMATIENGRFLTRRNYLMMTLTPLLTMTLIGGGSLLFLPPALGQLLLIALLMNAAASVGDLMVAQRVYSLPPQALFSDADGIQVFLPAPLPGRQNQPGGGMFLPKAQS